MLAGLTVMGALAAGCGTTEQTKKEKDGFFTSGSPEADRRAEKAVTEKNGVGNGDAKDGAKQQGKAGEESDKAQTLYARLGGDAGIKRIVDDFIQRVLEDPRVNWSRKGITSWNWLKREKATEWQATQENINRMKQHFVQFISVASGGPVEYDGKPLKPLHEDMQITKSEFDATIGDLKATLDKLQIAADVQKDLLAIFESTRQQIVVDR